MIKMTFPSACQRIRTHFYPIGFEATLDTPGSMRLRLFVVGTGEELLSMTDVPCASSLTAQDVEQIIQAIEADIDALCAQTVHERCG
ncbi:MAG: DUF1652 domain-containing protein [Pseudomonadota bacterium]